MLRTFANGWADDTVLVSYNGKCYDAPLLATRYRLARRPIRWPAWRMSTCCIRSRRRWRGLCENCRLATIERELLRVVREDDLPGPKRRRPGCRTCAAVRRATCAGSPRTTTRTW